MKDIIMALITACVPATVTLILELNKSERHIRGGEATKMKYKENEV